MCSANVSALAARKRSKQARRWWVRPSLRSREVAGHTGRLLLDLRSHDEEYFRDFMQMPPRTFDTLLELLRPAISKQDTDYRPAILAHDCLAMTITFLVTGKTQRDVAFNFPAGRSTVSSILSEVSGALWLVLQPLYLRHPSTTDEWMKAWQASISSIFAATILTHSCLVLLCVV
ncbi:uncharacterized protein LOC142776402 [Rhipicephalus microplus]|uniref:uncharacterized protein LOC142776402 n=1 Tax=Rhipicephalus microplus TaxID=6941 RepID=UPI003F6D5206